MGKYKVDRDGISGVNAFDRDDARDAPNRAKHAIEMLFVVDFNRNFDQAPVIA
jgi:hypothetical protein